MKQTFIYKRFNQKHEALIQTAEQIMDDMRGQGYDLSLRQLYYQFVAHHGLPNTEQSYKMLGVVISDARLAGRLDWRMLVDRGRSTLQNPHWDDPADVIDSAASGYKIDMWEGQEWHVEVMVEKQALEGVLVPVCRRLDVPFTSNKGYSSSSAMYRAGRRLHDKMNEGRKIAIIYLGDHDPSGLDMGRDVLDRLLLFSEAGEWVDDPDEMIYHNLDKPEVVINDEWEGQFVLERIALNMDQVRLYNPPPNPAKMTDSRAGGYVSKYGSSSWELDALEPSVLADLVSNAVGRYVDDEAMDLRRDQLARDKAILNKMAEDYRASLGKDED